MLSTLILLRRFPVLVVTVIIFILLVCFHLIRRYAIRTTEKSVNRLRLHKNTALISYKNGETQRVNISRICTVNDWIVLDFGQKTNKVLVDAATVGQGTFSHITRQLRTYKTPSTKHT